MIWVFVTVFWLQMTLSTIPTQAAPAALETLDSLLSDLQILAQDYEFHHNPKSQYLDSRNKRQYLDSRDKRRPMPLLATWFQQRRSSPSTTPQKVARTVSNQQDQNENSKISELNHAIHRLRMWEAALQRRFGDRFRDNPEQLAMHPLWVKVMKLRAMLHRLMALAETRTKALDTTRMKK